MDFDAHSRSEAEGPARTDARMVDRTALLILVDGVLTLATISVFAVNILWFDGGGIWVSVVVLGWAVAITAIRWGMSEARRQVGLEPFAEWRLLYGRAGRQLLASRGKAWVQVFEWLALTAFIVFSVAWLSGFFGG